MVRNRNSIDNYSVCLSLSLGMCLRDLPSHDGFRANKTIREPLLLYICRDLALPYHRADVRYSVPGVPATLCVAYTQMLGPLAL